MPSILHHWDILHYFECKCSAREICCDCHMRSVRDISDQGESDLRGTSITRQHGFGRKW
jgi:hypothetical protein